MQRNTTPNIDINNFKGLFTKNSPETLTQDQLRECKNADFFAEYGALGKIRGSSRVLTTPYTESAVAKSIPWIGFYKFQDLDGAIIRHKLIAAGTTIQKVENGGTLTQLGTGEPEGLFRTADRLDQFMYITAQDPFRVGNRGTPRRWDGEKLSDWGVTAPGRQETVIEDFSSTSGFTTSNGAVTTEDTTAWKTSSLKFTKGISDKVGALQKLNVTPFEIINTIEDRAEFHFFISRLDYRKLNSDTAVENGRAISIYISSDASLTWDTGSGSEEFYRFDYRIGQLVPGWNTLQIDFSVFPAGDFGLTVNMDGSTDDDLKSYRFEVVTTNDADTVDVYWDHFVSLDEGAPTGALTTGGSTSSVFNYSASSVWSYKTTFVDENGSESNAGPKSVEVDNTDAEVSQVIKEGFEDATEWDDTNGVITDDPADSSISGVGTQSISLTKVAGGVAYGGMETAPGSIPLNTDFSAATNDECKIDVKVSDKTNLNSIEIWFGDNGFNDYYKWSMGATEFDEGEWTTITFDLTSPDDSSGAPDLSSIEAIRIRIVANLAANAIADVNFDNLRVDTLNNYDSIELTDIPVSTNPAIVKRRLYRTTAGGASWLFLAAINNNTETTYSDTTSDGGLGTTEPPEAGLRLDAGPPPSAGIFKVWKRTGFLAGDPLNPTVLYFSEFDRLDKWPLINAFEFDEPITGIFKSNMGLVITTETGLWRVLGDNPDYVIDRVREKVGATGPRAVGEVRVEGWAVDRDGMRLYDLRDTIKVSELIRDRVDAFDKALLEDTHTKFSRAHNHINWFTKDSDGKYTDSYLYAFAYDDVRQGWWTELNLPSDVNILHTEEIEDDDGIFHLWGSDDSGMVYELFDPDADNWVNASGQESAVEFEIKSPWMRLGPLGIEVEGTTGRVVPYLIELRVHEVDGAAMTWTVDIETCDGPADNSGNRDSQTLTYSFPANRSLQRLPTQDLTSGEYIRFTIKNSDLDINPRLYG